MSGEWGLTVEQERTDKGSVIIVDDDRSLLNIIGQGLSLEGYRCESAPDAESALELISKTSFDMMITDIVLPGIDGFSVTEQARKLRPDMLVIIMTGFIEDFSYDRAIEAGASDFIKKPFTLQELVVRIRLVKLQAKLIRMSVTDELTGLYNRRGLFTIADQQFKLANRLNEIIYVLYADMDNLKGINDRFGHEEGDRALMETASILRTTFRQSDIIARISGDEFIVIPIGTTDEGARIAVSRLSQNLASYNASGDRGYQLLFSVGIASYNPKSPSSIDEVLSEADKSMYEQKRLKQKSQF